MIVCWLFVDKVYQSVPTLVRVSFLPLCIDVKGVKEKFTDEKEKKRSEKQTW